MYYHQQFSAATILQRPTAKALVYPFVRIVTPFVFNITHSGLSMELTEEGRRFLVATRHSAGNYIQSYRTHTYTIAEIHKCVCESPKNQFNNENQFNFELKPPLTDERNNQLYKSITPLSEAYTQMPVPCHCCC